MGSITCRALHVVTGSLALAAQASTASSVYKRLDGRGGFGSGVGVGAAFHVARQTIESDAGWSFGGR